MKERQYFFLTISLIDCSNISKTRQPISPVNNNFTFSLIIFYEIAFVYLNKIFFSESINHLYKKIIPQLENNLKDKYLPRLCYKNKTLTVVDNIEEIESKNLSSNEDDSELSKGQEKKEKKLRTLKKSDSTENKNRASRENVNKLTKEQRNREIKLRNSKKADSSKKENLDWSLSLREEFLKKLLELMISDNIGELKDALIHTVVWKEMTKYFPVHQSELENLWYNELHLQLYSPRPIYMNDVKIKLIEL